METGMVKGGEALVPHLFQFLVLLTSDQSKLVTIPQVDDGVKWLGTEWSGAIVFCCFFFRLYKCVMVSWLLGIMLRLLQYQHFNLLSSACLYVPHAYLQTQTFKGWQFLGNYVWFTVCLSVRICTPMFREVALNMLLRLIEHPRVIVLLTHVLDFYKRKKTRWQEVRMYVHTHMYMCMF